MSTSLRKKTYAQDGVDVDQETLFSRFAGSICRASYENSPFVKIHDFSKGHFRGPRPFTLKNLPPGYSIEASTDGVGTKGILIDAAQTHDLAAYDIIAMTASDITRFGGIPLVFINVFDIVSVGKEGNRVNRTYKSMIEGLGKVAKQEKLVVLKGETAQMGKSLGSELTASPTKFNWSGTMIGAYHKSKMVTGDTLAPRQVIIALKENGFRCNGISSVRKALQEKFGKNWWRNPKASTSIKRAAAPSVLYDPFINTLHGWFHPRFKPEINIHSIIHLSGGGLKEKLAKDVLFPRGLSAVLDNLWKPPQIMKECANWRHISDEEFYEVWNGGQGMLLVIDEKDAPYCLKRARDFSLQARIAGHIAKESSPTVTITSMLTKDSRVTYYP